MDPRTYDLLLLNLVPRATDRRLRSGGFCGEVDVLLSKGIQGFQPVEEGQHHSVLTGLVDTYVDEDINTIVTPTALLPYILDQLLELAHAN